MEQNLQKTPLYEACLKAGGKMVDFHGWLLPVQFESIIAEHKAVRTNAGMFDVSHMGQIIFKGPDAYKFLQYASTNNFKAEIGRGAYSHIVNENGGIIDDIIAFCINEQEFFVVVNSATCKKDYAWFKEKSKNFQVEVLNVSDKYSMLALQGPKVLAILEELDKDIKNLKRFYIKKATIFAREVLITRTGYTGEDGVEIMGSADTINKLFAWGLTHNIKPCGLGARDLLRLESGYLLSGSDMDETKTPYEASCGWVVKLSKEDFIGKNALAKQKEEGIKKCWSGFILTEPGVAREGCKIYQGEKEIGYLTSATFSPVYKAICAGYAPSTLEEGEEVQIEVRGRKIKAKKIKMPFYQDKI
ncbi:MAG: glycine cleavage system aminomethyltransferase GcvT [Elusimicrobiaceae bacterium]|nr:glycine cleavage system aminomethyltransferase GcvT [Elusimicrobiaceae bacterium]